MLQGASPLAWRYLIAVLASAAFVTLRLLLEPTLQGRAPLMALLAAPIISAWLGGFGPGLLATLLSAAAGEILFVPAPVLLSQTPAEALRLAIFVSCGVLFSWLLHMRRSTIADLRLQHEQLSKAEQRARETLEASPSGMIVVNNRGTIELVNAQAERLFGYSRDELVGTPVEQLVPEPARGGHAGFRARYHLAPAQRPMGTANQVLFARRRNGSVFPVEIGLNPLQGASAGLVLASVLDVSQRHAAEQALREEDRRKDEFIAVLAHELRNPLAPVRTAVAVVQRTAPADARLRRATDIIDRQVAQMARLLDDLLDVSRIARGKLSLQIVRCDLAALTQQVAEDYRASLEASGLALVVAAPAEPVWVDGDPVRLAQMLGNLLTNAQRFNGDGGRIEVGVAADARARTTTVAVTDTGEGLDAAMLSRLFQPFQQAAQDLARSRGGLGLGLALTKGLAELHRGDVVAESEGPGRGARFTIRLPLAAPRVEPAAAVQRAEAAGAARVLVVEDNPDAAYSLAELLQLLGHQTHVCLDGAAGLAAAREFRPDVVLSDLGLPGAVDGYQLARSLRALPELDGVTLVALSGYADTASRERSMAAGFDAHLAKPADVRALQHVLAARAGQSA